EEVTERLESEGITILRAENLSLIDQIRLFANSRLIVGLHGSGLTNVLFAPQAAVLELIGNYGDGQFYSMTSGLGQPYGVLKCHAVGEDVIVDVDSVLRAADQMFSATSHCRPTAGRELGWT